jgi:hypothetical protein
MVNFEPFGLRTDGTPAALLRVQALDVFDREDSAILSDARSAIGCTDASKRFHPLWVFALPFAQKLQNLFWVLLGIAFHFGAVAAWIFGSAASSSGRFVSWSLFQPTFVLGNTACDTGAVGRPAQSAVPVLAWLSAIVMPIATLLRGGTFRGHLTGSVEAQRFLPIAQDAVSGARPSIRQMAVSARFAGVVGGMARSLCGGSFRNGSHTFTVIRLA